MDERARVASDPQRLEDLRRKVERARSALRRCRGVQRDKAEHERCRADLVEALQEYAALAAATGTPLPYRLRDELRLYGALSP